MANHVPTSTSFKPDHKHSAKPRKRTALSEEILRDYIYTDGRDALDKIKIMFNRQITGTQTSQPILKGKETKRFHTYITKEE